MLTSSMDNELGRPGIFGFPLQVARDVASGGRGDTLLVVRKTYAGTGYDVSYYIHVEVNVKIQKN